MLLLRMNLIMLYSGLLETNWLLISAKPEEVICRSGLRHFQEPAVIDNLEV